MIKERLIEYIYDGFQGCNNRNPDICLCATEETPECSVCGEEIEPGTTVQSITRQCNPFAEEAGYETFERHKVCPQIMTSN